MIVRTRNNWTGGVVLIALSGYIIYVMRESPYFIAGWLIFVLAISYWKGTIISFFDSKVEVYYPFRFYTRSVYYKDVLEVKKGTGSRHDITPLVIYYKWRGKTIRAAGGYPRSDKISILENILSNHNVPFKK